MDELGDFLPVYEPDYSHEDSNDTSSTESVSSKMLREVDMISAGVGSAFLDTAKNPLSKAPELATATGFGAALQVLRKSGSKGRSLATLVGVGAAVKFSIDEYLGDRWSNFGAAVKDNWQGPENYSRNVDITKSSVGSLAVDTSVAIMGFKLAGFKSDKSTASKNLSPKESLDLDAKFTWKTMPSNRMQGFLLEQGGIPKIRPSTALSEVEYQKLMAKKVKEYRTAEKQRKQSDGTHPQSKLPGFKSNDTGKLRPPESSPNGTTQETGYSWIGPSGQVSGKSMGNHSNPAYRMLGSLGEQSNTVIGRNSQNRISDASMFDSVQNRMSLKQPDSLLPREARFFDSKAAFEVPGTRPDLVWQGRSTPTFSAAETNTINILRTELGEKAVSNLEAVRLTSILVARDAKPSQYVKMFQQISKTPKDAN